MTNSEIMRTAMLVTEAELVTGIASAMSLLGLVVLAFWLYRADDRIARQIHKWTRRK